MDTQIRNEILDGKKNFTIVDFVYNLSDGSTVFLKIREPSIAEVNKVNDLRFTNDEKGNLKVKQDSHLDITVFYLANLVTTVNGEKIFELTDKENLLDYPAYSEIARLIDEVWNVARGVHIKKKTLEQPKEI